MAPAETISIASHGPTAFAPSRSGVALVALFAGLLLLPASALSQTTVPRTEDADLAEPGRLLVELAPVFQSWNEIFTAGPDEEGRRRPLAERYDGPVLARLYPGPDPYLEDLNQDAGALGFEPVDAAGGALGSLEVRELQYDVRAVPLRFEMGVVDRVAVDLTVPLVRTEAELFSSFDSTTSAVGLAADALEDSDTFFAELQDARQSLQNQVDGGELSPEEQAAAEDLLAATGAFADALDARISEGRYLFLAGSGAGSEVLAHYASMSDGFDQFGLDLPDFSLPQVATSANLDRLATDQLDAERPGTTTAGWALGEIEVGARVGLLDTFSPDSAASWIQARTTVGGRLRLPTKAGDEAPFPTPSDALGVGVGDGQTDVEISVYQDVRLGRKVRVTAVGRYGIQRPDRLDRRVHALDRPLALSTTEMTVDRDLGDYVQARIAPRLVVNDFLSLGAEYRYWHKGADSYSLVQGPGDASPLEEGTEQTRHRLGVGVFYRSRRPEPGEDPESVPEFGFVHQTAVAGSGPTTPSAGLTTVYVRFPVGVF